MNDEDDPFPGSFRGGQHRVRGNVPGPAIEHAVCDEWIKMLRVLMEEKFIYQNLSLNTDVFNEHTNDNYPHQVLLNEFSKRPAYPLSDGNTERKVASPDWMLSGAMAFNLDGNDEDQPLPFYLPTLQLHCKTCKGERTFGSLIDSRSGYLQTVLNKKQKSDVKEQAYTFYYQCNGCDSRSIVFQVVRSGLKLQLTGRSDPLRPPVGKWPSDVQEIVEDASQAVAENDINAGFYHLRTAVEHYLKSQLRIDVSERKRGEELVEEYKKTLSKKVRDTAPPLSTVYNDLSECMHSRKGDLFVFSSNLKKFKQHIAMKKMIEEIDNT